MNINERIIEGTVLRESGKSEVFVADTNMVQLINLTNEINDLRNGSEVRIKISYTVLDVKKEEEL